MAGENKLVAKEAARNKGGNEYQRNKSPRRLRFSDLMRPFDFSNLFNYDKITGRLPFLIFVSLLAVTYIWNRHAAEGSVRTMNETQRELIELEWYYDTAKDELARKSRQSAVAELVADQDIKELTRPPKVIEVRKR